jgi:hypothetical protein
MAKRGVVHLFKSEYVWTMNDVSLTVRSAICGRPDGMKTPVSEWLAGRIVRIAMTAVPAEVTCTPCLRDMKGA